MNPETTVRYARETATYERHRAELERKYPGRIAFMRGDELLGVFKTWEKGIKAVLKRFKQQEQCYWQEIGQPVHLEPMWARDLDVELPPPLPPFEVYFEQELATYERHRAELERDHWLEFALIRGDELVKVFKDEDEAMAEASRRFGLGKFMLHQIGDPVYYFPNCILPGEEEEEA